MKEVRFVFLSSLLVASHMALAQHMAGGAPSVGTATPAGSSSSSGGGSSTGGSDGGGTAPAIAGHRVPSGHSSSVSANTTNGVFTNYSQLSPVPEFGRPRNGLPVIGTAIPRSAAPAGASGGVTFIEGTYNPWIYAYEGLAETPLFGVFDPFAGDLGYPLAAGTATASTPSTREKGVLHFNVRPRDAEVYVDGARVGKADEFEGLLHRLRLEAGVHRVELRAPGYRPVVVEVRMLAGESITYRGILEKDAD